VNQFVLSPACLFLYPAGVKKQDRVELVCMDFHFMIRKMMFKNQDKQDRQDEILVTNPVTTKDEL